MCIVESLVLAAVQYGSLSSKQHLCIMLLPVLNGQSQCGAGDWEMRICVGYENVCYGKGKEIERVECRFFRRIVGVAWCPIWEFKQ